MELSELTFPKLLAGIDKTMAPGVGFHMLIGSTRQGKRLLQDDPAEPLPHAEMMRMTNKRLVSIWWSLNPPSEPMNLLCCCHRRNDTEDSTHPPGKIRFAPHDNLGRPPDTWDHGSAGSDDGQSSDGHQPESSAAAAKRTTPTRTIWSGNTRKRAGRTHASIGRTLANQSQTLLVGKLVSLVLSWALVF